MSPPPFSSGGLSDPWDGHLFYSPYLARKLGASTPFDQAGLFASSLLGMGYLISSSHRSYHVMKASSFPINSDDRDYHKYLGNVTEEGLKSARAFAQRIKTKGFLGFLAAPTLWMTYVFIKHPKK